MDSILRDIIVVLVKTHGLIHFLHINLQIKKKCECFAKPLVFPSPDKQAIPLTTTKTITTFSDYPSEKNNTSALIPLDIYGYLASPIFYYPLLTIFGKAMNLL